MSDSRIHVCVCNHRAWKGLLCVPTMSVVLSRTTSFFSLFSLEIDYSRIAIDRTIVDATRSKDRRGTKRRLRSKDRISPIFRPSVRTKIFFFKIR